MAALRHDRIAAPCVIDGPINGASFGAHIEQFLLPTLHPGGGGVMDNLGSHTGKAETLLRKTDPRTIEATWRGIGDLLDRFTPPNAPITLPMQAMLQPNRITL